MSERDRKKEDAFPINQDVEHNLQSPEEEREIERRHQYQMFPTPDEEFASEVITELKD